MKASIRQLPANAEDVEEDNGEVNEEDRMGE
jgi:hypothetical protein